MIKLFALLEVEVFELAFGNSECSHMLPNLANYAIREY